MVTAMCGDGYPFVKRSAPGLCAIEMKRDTEVQKRQSPPSYEQAVVLHPSLHLPSPR